MTQWTDYTEDLILKHLLGDTTWTKPGGTHLAGFEVMPSDDGTGATEATYSNYGRTAITQLDATWTLSTITDGQQIVNASSISLPTPSATDGNDLVGIGIYNAASGGDLMCYATLGSNITPTNAVPITWAASAMVWQFTGVAGRMCDPLAQAILNHIFRTSTWARYTDIFIDLVTTMPNQAGSGGIDYAGNGYAQQDLGPLAANWTFDAAAGTATYNNAITFSTNPTADWTGIDGQVLKGDSTTLMKLDYADAPRTYVSGQPVRIGAGQLIVTMS